MKPNAQEMLAGLALVIMGAVALCMCFNVTPAANHDYMLIILGALGGALGVSGGSKIADKLTTSTGPDASITTESSKP